MGAISQRNELTGIEVSDFSVSVVDLATPRLPHVCTISGGDRTATLPVADSFWISVFPNPISMISLTLLKLLQPSRSPPVCSSAQLLIVNNMQIFLRLLLLPRRRRRQVVVTTTPIILQVMVRQILQLRWFNS